MEQEKINLFFREMLTRPFEAMGLEGLALEWSVNAILIIFFTLTALLTNYVLNGIILRQINKTVNQTSTHWDDILLRRRLFDRLVRFIPATILYYGVSISFSGTAGLVDFLQRLILVYMIVLGSRVIQVLLNTINEIYEEQPISKDRPIKGYLQSVTLFMFLISGILILSTLLNKDPGYFLTGLGALTAIILLIFRDSILGFVASIQMAANNMVRIGDWVEFPKFNADGDVIDITLTTVKVQNWDKTITTIPPYAFVSDSFKNWRGMSDSDGRRIKRSIFLDMTSMHFCSPAELKKFQQFTLIKEYLAEKKKELQAWNKERGIKPSDAVNQRKLTNVGTFRAYVINYLKAHPMINEEMTFLVRQLQPKENGLPLEIYVFCKDKVWANYESIQADIFDHLLSMIPEFNLQVFQNPTGSDFQNLKRK